MNQAVTPNDKPRYANVIIDISHEKVDRPFQYLIPRELLNKVVVGACVEIPFGRGNTNRTGYVIETVDIPDYPINKIKSITGVVDNNSRLETNRIRLASWMKERYGTTMITALKTVLPIRRYVREKTKRTIVSITPALEYEALLNRYEKRHQQGRIRLIRYFMGGETSIDYDEVRSNLGVTDSVIKAMTQDKVISIVSEAMVRDPFESLENKEEELLPLTKEQKEVVDGILESYDGKNPSISLIHGVTGSGKTRIYMEIIAGMQAKGLKSILLIPEISLTYQNVVRFRNRFKDKVCVLHSRLSAGERYDQWERARRGETDIMIGPRSALFAPFENIGAIIIDEEHEGSYKSEHMPRYHAREVASKMASFYGASLVLGSATPSLETYQAAMTGRINYYKLDKRPTGGTLPKVEILDMRQEFKTGNTSLISNRLSEMLEDVRANKRQAMLFLNRRGYQGFISCRSCGNVIKCPHCDVSLTRHMDGNLVCHYCSYTTRNIQSCPKCGSPHIYGFKAGTQQVEQELSVKFPGLRILRLDGDTTKKKGSLDAILTAFSRHEADVLLGTQMIVKGHDFPLVSLVGILNADLSIFSPDYRAAERTFQLLTQAAGRAGRGDVPGTVIIQTCQPEHYAVTSSKNHDYEGFYKQEIAYRNLLGYPPAGNMLEVLISSLTEENAISLAEHLSGKCRELSEDFVKRAKDGFNVIGPARAGIYKLEDRYRMVFYVKANKLGVVTAVMNSLESYISARDIKGCNIVFDVNPLK